MDKVIALLLMLGAGLMVLLVLSIYYVLVPFLLMVVLALFDINVGFWSSFMIVILFYIIVGVVKK